MKRYLYKDNTIVNQPAIVKDGHQLGYYLPESF